MRSLLEQIDLRKGHAGGPADLYADGRYLATPATAAEPTVDELKARIASTDVRDRPRLCVEIAELQLKTIDKLYADPTTPKHRLR